MRHLVLVGCLTIGACGLDEGGLGQPDAAEAGGPGDIVATMPGDSDDASNSNDGGRGSADATSRPDGGAMEATAPLVEAGSPCPTFPSGWSLALFEPGTNACPSRFTTHDVVGSATSGAGACSCTCTVTQPDSCTQGQLSVSYGSGGSPCDTPTWSATIDGPSCTVLGSPVMTSGMPSNVATPLPPQGGTCTQAAHADSSLLSTSKARYCDVPADSSAAVCSGTVPSGFAACIVTDGETACPSGSSFVQRHIVEDSATLQCSDCSGTCMMTTTCLNAMVTGFADSTCMTRLGSVAVDGTCHPVMFYVSLPATLMAVEYTATPSSTCTAGSSTSSVQLANPRTICCR